MNRPGLDLKARRRRIVAVISLCLLAALAAWLTLTPAGRATARAALFVLDILPQGEHSLLRAVTSPLSVEEVTFPYAGGQTGGYLYRSAGDGPHGGVVIALGHGPTWSDPLLVRVADDLARLGVVVLVPRLPGLSVGYLSSEDVEALVGAFEYLAARPEVDAKHVGFAGFCVGSSMALVAAEDPRINDRVAYVNAFGGYYDLRDLLRAVATHSAQYTGQEHLWNPTREAVTMFAQNTLLYLDDAGDRQRVAHHLTGGGSADQTLRDLTPTDQLIYTLLASSDPATVDAAIAALPADIHARLAALSPSSGVERLRARVFIMHDVSDPYVPITEAYRLADAIADPGQKVYAEFALFEHVYPTHPLHQIALAWEGVRLIAYLGQLLAEMTPD